MTDGPVVRSFRRRSFRKLDDHDGVTLVHHGNEATWDLRAYEPCRAKKPDEDDHRAADPDRGLDDEPDDRGISASNPFCS
jgi:hypothetical protein